ncbi:MAG: cytochrome c [Bacteroidales bacterium]|nr:cytochrome c [Bacteroidales bacterium]
MNKTFKCFAILSSVLLFLGGCYNDNEYDLYPFPSGPCDSTSVSYSTSIAPIITANCNVCHSTANPSGNVITDTWEGLNTQALNGNLWGGVNWENGYIPMPKDASKLSDCDLAKIKNWINQGAPNN